MRKWIIAAVIGLAGAGDAWAWDDEDDSKYYMKEMDEVELQFGSPKLAINPNKDDVENYIRNKQSYDEAVGRMAIHSAKQLEKIKEQQQRLIELQEEQLERGR
jgi:hypothetical protein